MYSGGGGGVAANKFVSNSPGLAIFQTGIDTSHNFYLQTIVHKYTKYNNRSDRVAGCRSTVRSELI